MYTKVYESDSSRSQCNKKDKANEKKPIIDTDNQSLYQLKHSDLTYNGINERMTVVAPKKSMMQIVKKLILHLNQKSYNKKFYGNMKKVIPICT